MNTPKRLFDFAHYAAAKHPRPDALNTKINGQWQSMSTVEFVAKSEKLACGLIDMGLQPGERVGIISANNRSEWNLCDQAILSAGCIDVPMYPTISQADYEFILTDSGMRFCFVSDVELRDKIEALRPGIPTLEAVFTFSPTEGSVCLDEVVARAKDSHYAELEARKAAVGEEDLATIIYTSGTTGTPKGVMLSHRNIASNAVAGAGRLPVGPTGKALSFLPLCHSYERVCVYVYMTNGVGVYFAESMETIGDNLREVHPQVFTAVPRLLEKVYDKIMDKGKALTGIKRGLFFWAVGLAERYEHEGLSTLYYAQLKLARKLIFSKWQEALGGEVLAVASGAAALNPKLARIFAGAGINVQEGYGLTETSPILAVNLPTGRGHKLGTVGTAIEGVSLKLDTDGEILAKGPNVMMGYYKRPDLTAEVMTEDGWFRTGDIGELDSEGYLRITDRKKEIFKTAGGKYITPQAMENAFKMSSFIEQCMVAGDNQKFPVLLIQPQYEFLKSWCSRKGIDWTSPAEMIADPRIIARFQREIDATNAQFGQWEKVKKFALTPDVWSIAAGHVTPTLKLRRKPILQRYAGLYEGLYEEASN
jgi:long-chain acyl-CoA synthetase